MGWDNNIDATHFKGKLPVQSFNQLMGAIRERIRAIGGSVPSELSTDFQKGDLPSSNFFYTFQYWMSILIPYYVDHTNSYPIVKKYNEASLLAAIGDATRLPYPKQWQASAAWCYQQYKMLNKMRWAIPSWNVYLEENNIYWYEGYEEYVNYMYRYKTYPRGNVTFSDGLSILASTSWGEWGWKSDGNMGYDEIGGYFGNWESGGLYWQGGNLWNFSFNSSKYSTGCQVKRSWKRKTSAPFPNIDLTLLDTESSSSSSFRAVQHASGVQGGDLIQNDTMYAGSDTIEVLTPNETVLPVTDFIEPSYTYNAYYRFSLMTGSVLAKLDGANGFTYKDW